MIVMSQRYIKAFLRLMKKKGYVIAEKPYQINIVGVRSDSTIPNKFDDRIYVFWKTPEGKWEGRDYPATTDPSTYWLEKPMAVSGTAILKQGQYRYTIGLHKGQYKALVQDGPVTVIRDYDRNAILDFNNGREETGKFGINIHRAASAGTTVQVGMYSAGCQVFASAADFDDFMALATRSIEKYGPVYYTLIDERAMSRAIRRRFVYVLMAIGGALAIYGGQRYISGKPFFPR